MDTITVIVPVYNIEKYIERCVKSIVAQTYTDLQIILVDDGSTDMSGRICDRLALMDKRIEVIHKENEGLSVARNTGLNRARGLFVGFVDGDDYIETDMYAVLHKAISSAKDVDIVSCGFYEHFADKTRIRCCMKQMEILTRVEAYEALFAQQLACSSCSKLFRRALFDKVRYRPGLRSEDVDLLYKVLNYVQKVICMDVAKYHYVHRGGSITTGILCMNCMDIISISDEIVEFINQKYPQLNSWAYVYQASWLIDSMRKIYATDNRQKYKDEQSYIRRKVIKNMKHYWANPHISIGNYIILWSIFWGMFAPVEWLLNRLMLVYMAGKRGKV